MTPCLKNVLHLYTYTKLGLLGMLYTEHMLLSISDEARTQSSFPLINCANSVKALKLL